MNSALLRFSRTVSFSVRVSCVGNAVSFHQSGQNVPRVLTVGGKYPFDRKVGHAMYHVRGGFKR